MGLVLALAVLLGVMALPAAADEPRGPDVGVFQGTALVGKSGTCDNEGGLHDVSGGGIGAPVVNGRKNAQYSINAANSVVSKAYGLGSLRLCGYLTSPLGISEIPVDDELEETPETVPVGASCASTKGWGGQGRATFTGLVTPKQPASTVVYLTNLGWKITVGGTFLVTADAGGAKGKKTSTLVALVQALSEGAVVGCLEKVVAMMDKSGLQPDPFTVAAAYTILPVENPQEKKPPKK